MQNSRFKSISNRLRRKIFSHVVAVRLFLIVAGFTLLIGAIVVMSKFTFPLGSLLFGQNLTQSHGRTNVLILGIRGQGHDGPDMTDTMIFVSLRHSDGQISLISFPRDLWSEVIKAKINSAYHLGYIKEATSGGLLLSKTVISEISGTPVHYAAMVDFSLFTRFIDTLGGVDLHIPKAFDDYKFPIPGKENDLCDGDPETLCRYEHLHFDAGTQHLDGQTALKYVRSRQSTDLSEGTDFARNKRQEQLISALKTKLISQPPFKHFELYRLVKSTIITDLRPANYLPLAKLLLKARSLPLQSLSINEDNLVDHPPVDKRYNHQWVLIPKANNPSLIPEFFQKNLP